MDYHIKIRVFKQKKFALLQIAYLRNFAA